ncbi:MarR family winged helix-turn-helix transcriptional regulator [uncultured Mycobacterium sp.]|uniref:MarR family winged helix-turn-helix transcriptional regulator n=1 Tax=uncultured Mycobacterium sp. TaxID=171292 RepID=UPI0035CA1C13
MAESSLVQTDGVGFRLAELGHLAATLFADQMATMELTLTQAGILRAIAAMPGRSQHALRAYLGVLPGRLVAYVDELEERGYVERRRNPGDRRLHALYLTDAGKKLMRKLSGLTRQHESQLTAGLGAEERGMLRGLLVTVARQRGLTPDAHNGYRVLAVLTPAG